MDSSLTTSLVSRFHCPQKDYTRLRRVSPFCCNATHTLPCLATMDVWPWCVDRPRYCLENYMVRWLPAVSRWLPYVVQLVTERGVRCHLGLLSLSELQLCTCHFQMWIDQRGQKWVTEVTLHQCGMNIVQSFNTSSCRVCVKRHSSYWCDMWLPYTCAVNIVLSQCVM